MHDAACMELDPKRSPTRTGHALPPLRSSAQARAGTDEVGQLAAHVVEWLAEPLPAAVVVFSPVDRRLNLYTTAPLVAHYDAWLDIDALRREYLARGRALDPFAPARWSQSSVTVVSAGDVGGADALARSSYGRFLAHHGLIAHASMLFREHGRIVAAAVLLGESHRRQLTTAEIRLLRRCHPFLEQVLTLAGSHRPPVLAVDPLHTYGLTPRELDVARLAAAGATNEEISRALYVSLGTVKTHMTHVLAKLRLRSRTELVMQLRADRDR